MDSSLLFLALIGLWLCYLVPGVLRRRHDASAARLDDRFSDGIRTLDQRPPRVGRQMHGRLLRQGAAPVDVDVATHPADRASTCPRSTVRPSARARLLGALLALSVAATPVAVVLAGLGALTWTAAAVAPALAVLSFALLRHRARSRRSGAKAPGTVLTDGPLPTDRLSLGVVATTATTRSTELVDVAAAELLPATVLHDEDAVRAVERAAAVAAARAAAEAEQQRREQLLANQAPGEWLPREVPKPAYLLKPAAPRRHVPVVDVRESVTDVRESRVHETDLGVTDLRVTDLGEGADEAYGETLPRAVNG